MNENISRTCNPGSCRSTRLWIPHNLLLSRNGIVTGTYDSVRFKDNHKGMWENWPARKHRKMVTILLLTDCNEISPGIRIVSELTVLEASDDALQDWWNFVTTKHIRGFKI